MSIQDMDEDEFDELHHAILDELRDGRVTPSYVAEKTGESRQLMSSRLRDLVMGEHVEKIHTGLYELVDDPQASERDGNLDRAVMTLEDAQHSDWDTDDRSREERVQEAMGELKAWLDGGDDGE